MINKTHEIKAIIQIKYKLNLLYVCSIMFRLKWNLLRKLSRSADGSFFICAQLLLLHFHFVVLWNLYFFLVLIAYQTLYLYLYLFVLLLFHYLSFFLSLVLLFDCLKKTTNIHLISCFLYKFSIFKTNEKFNDNKKLQMFGAGVGWNNTKQNIEQMECADLSFCAPFIRFFLLFLLNFVFFSWYLFNIFAFQWIWLNPGKASSQHHLLLFIVVYCYVVIYCLICYIFYFLLISLGLETQVPESSKDLYWF